MTATSSRLLLILLLALPASAQGVPKKEQKLREKLAKVWVEYGKWARSKSLKAEATDAVARAKWAWPNCPDVPSLRSAVRSIKGEKTPDKAAKKKRIKANKDAGGYTNDIDNIMGSVMTRVNNVDKVLGARLMRHDYNVSAITEKRMTHVRHIERINKKENKVLKAEVKKAVISINEEFT